MDYSHVAILAAVRRLGSLPTATAAGCADSDILAHANAVLQSEIAPMVMELREEHYLTANSLTITAGTAAYRIPSRAMGSKLRDVAMKDSAGNFRSLARTEYDELEDYQATEGDAEAFYLRGNYVVLVPPPSDASETLELPFYMRPSEIVSTGYGTISIINTTTGQITFVQTGSFVPTTSTPVDLVSKSVPFECHSFDVTPTAAASNTVTVSSVPSGLVVGDFVCLAEQSPLPQVPAEFVPLLNVKTARRMAQSLGSATRISYLEAEEGKLTDQIRRTFAPRVDGEAKIAGGGVNYLLGEGW